MNENFSLNWGIAFFEFFDNILYLI
jgi:hypothetical protein